MLTGKTLWSGMKPIPRTLVPNSILDQSGQDWLTNLPKPVESNPYCKQKRKENVPIDNRSRGAGNV